MGSRTTMPRLGIDWPLPVTEMSPKDAAWRPFAEVEAELHRRMSGEEETMILVDTALAEREREGRPIRVGMVGAGFMGQGLTNQIVHSVPGMRMVAVANRHPERAA